MNTVKKASEGLTIGKLIKELKKVYSDISTSKLRFLESQGLVNPKRGVNKYRVYTKDDVKRINFILKMQKEFYLPLEVIKEKLKSKEYEEYLKDGKELKNLQLDLKEDLKDEQKPRFLPCEDLKKKIKISQDFIDDLIDHELVEYKNDNGKIMINSEDINIVRMAKELSSFGIQGKHLKICRCLKILLYGIHLLFSR